jgi:Tol biopolymer transport system component
MNDCLAVDGQWSPLQGEWGASLALSPDGKRVAYAANIGKKWLVVVDGKAGPEVDGGKFSAPPGLSFSPDGKRFAYTAKTGNQWSVVVDGQAGASYDGIGPDSLVFSPDSSRVAYIARTGKRMVSVIDGRPSAEYEEIRGLVFSPDSQHVAYGERQGGKWSVVLDGQPDVAYDNLMYANRDPFIKQELGARLVFSADSKHLAYGALRRGKWVMVVDGKEGEEHDEIGIGSPAFSPDGKRTAYSVRTGSWVSVRTGPASGLWSVIVDGKEVAGPRLGNLCAGA